MPLTTKHQVLAWDLVEGLGDEKHKGIYFRLAKTYDEGFLRRVLSLVKDAWHRGKIKNEDRGRYFMGVLKKELKMSGDTALILRSKPRRLASPKKGGRYSRRAGRKK